MKSPFINQAEDDVLVFRGIHVAAQYAGSVPYLFFKADVGVVSGMEEYSSPILALMCLFYHIFMFLATFFHPRSLPNFTL